MTSEAYAFFSRQAPGLWYKPAAFIKPLSEIVRCMKTAFTILLLIAVLASGCTTATPAVPPVQTVVTTLPNLTGNWTGPMQGYDEREGFTDHPFLTAVMTISEQHGRVFSGFIVFRSNSTESTDEFAGVIGRDNRTLTIAEHGGGYSSGEVLAPDEIELIYMQDGSPYSISIDSWRRV